MRLPKPFPGSRPVGARRRARRILAQPGGGRSKPWGPRAASLGIDISASAVKLVELSQRRSGASRPRVAAWGVEKVPAATVDTTQSGGNISDPEAVGDVIRNWRRRAGSKARAAVFAVPHSAAIVTSLRLDATLTDEELEVEVAMEAERHIPFPPEEITLDFEPSHLCPDDPSLVEVSVVACRRAQVRCLEAVAAASGLKADAVELDTTALCRAAQWRRTRAGVGQPDPGASHDAVPELAADLGARAITMVAVADDDLVFARQEPFGAPAAAPAERLADELGMRLLRLLRLFMAGRAPGDGTRGERLLLAGGHALTPGIVDLASTRLGLPVEVAKPFAGFVDGDCVGAAAPRLMIACGLALRDVARPPRERSVDMLAKIEN